MTDDKKKKGGPDRYLIAFKERYEFDYAVKQLQKRFPRRARQAIKDALTKAAKTVDPSRGRERIMRLARKYLGGSQ